MTMTNPSALVIMSLGLPKALIIHSSTEAASNTRMSVAVTPPIPSGNMTADVPSAKKTLKTTLPTTFPSAIAVSPFFAAITDAASSGAEVPAETIVSAITDSLTPIHRANPDAPSTSPYPPAMSRASPIMTHIKCFHSGFFLPLFSVLSPSGCLLLWAIDRV